jgi:hypothetical protein
VTLQMGPASEDIPVKWLVERGVVCVSERDPQGVVLSWPDVGAFKAANLSAGTLQADEAWIGRKPLAHDDAVDS